MAYTSSAASSRSRCTAPDEEGRAVVEAGAGTSRTRDLARVDARGSDDPASVPPGTDQGRRAFAILEAA